MDILPEITAQTIDNSKDSELIYLSAIICHKLTEIQKQLELNKLLIYDARLQSIFEMKQKWIEKFMSTDK